ncbi:MAG: site-2 protease family protein [Verrucomicrobiota bacterium]|nr:site-2 protease family protein [Verrucomicrobiota bacterium]MEE2615163.1 site-2 protease family protein [Verrucomicrobiota bacterium]
MDLDISQLSNALALWMCLVVLLSFHEFAHAWMAYKCGDDTARMMGRMTINPVVHIDPIGTIFIPLAMLLLSPSFVVFGWAKPVPVNPSNLSSRKRDDILISMAGPVMNLILAFVLMFVLRILLELSPSISTSIIVEKMPQIALISLFLCFFNLIPIPPLDGSHVMRHVVGMSEEMYYSIAKWGFLILIVVLNFFPVVGASVAKISMALLYFMMNLLMFP